MINNFNNYINKNIFYNANLLKSPLTITFFIILVFKSNYYDLKTLKLCDYMSPRSDIFMRMNMKYNINKYQFREKTLVKILDIIKKQDHTKPDGHLFFGDSIIEGIPNDLPIINNGISGMSSEVIETLLDELVIKFNPRAVYLHVGTNDLGNTVMASPRDIALNIQRIMLIIQRNLPNAKLFVISTLPCLDEFESFYATGKGIRSNDLHQILNIEIQDHLKHTNVTYLDLHSHLLNGDGSVKSGFYQDGLHLNEEGYQFLIQKFKNMIQ